MLPDETQASNKSNVPEAQEILERKRRDERTRQQLAFVRASIKELGNTIRWHGMTLPNDIKIDVLRESRELERMAQVNEEQEQLQSVIRAGAISTHGRLYTRELYGFVGHVTTPVRKNRNRESLPLLIPNFGMVAGLADSVSAGGFNKAIVSAVGLLVIYLFDIPWLAILTLVSMMAVSLVIALVGDVIDGTFSLKQMGNRVLVRLLMVLWLVFTRLFDILISSVKGSESWLSTSPTLMLFVGIFSVMLVREAFTHMVDLGYIKGALARVLRRILDKIDPGNDKGTGLPG